MAVVGRVEKINFPKFKVYDIPAKIDTGADLSSVWASDISVRNGKLLFKLFDEGSKYYTGHEIQIDEGNYKLTRVASSFGHKELRYVIKLPVKVRDKRIRATFTLADRSKKTYPVLIGRKLLNKKFLVDVSAGSPLMRVEKRKKKMMKNELKKLTKKEKL